jgi:hypothetical protein
LLVKLLDRVPVKFKFLGYIFDCGRATPSPNIIGKTLGRKRVVNYKFQALALYFAATPAIHTAHLEIEIDAHVPARQISNPPAGAVIKTPADPIQVAH